MNAPRPRRRKTSLRSLFPLRMKAESAVSALPDLMAAAERAATSVLSGEHAQRKAGSGEKFWQFREYAEGDRPQDIDWRQSAKGDRLYIRQKEWQTTQTSLLWVQSDNGMEFSSAANLPRKRDEGLVMALALGMLFTRAGELVALMDGEHRPGRSAKALDIIGEDLLKQPPETLPHPAAKHIPVNSSLVLIGDFLSNPEETRQVIDSLAARAATGIMIQIMDPAELSLPFEGRMIFEEPTGAQEHHITEVDAIRTAYRQRIDAHLDTVRGLCRGHGWDWVLHRTDRALVETLHQIWQLISVESGSRKGRPV